MVIRGISPVLPACSLRINLGKPVNVKVGAPIDTSGRSKEELAQIMWEVRHSLEVLLGDGKAE